jgi:hypothetical protein
VFDETLLKLKEKMSRLSDDELLNIVEVEAGDYRPEAVEFAKAELDLRGITYAELPPQPLAGEDDGEYTGGGVPRERITCSRCGALTRPAVLFADREMTVVFSDGGEERFVQVYVCSQCGRVEMIVDFDTDVAS